MFRRSEFTGFLPYQMCAAGALEVPAGISRPRVPLPTEKAGTLPGSHSGWITVLGAAVRRPSRAALNSSDAGREGIPVSWRFLRRPSTRPSANCLAAAPRENTIWMRRGRAG